jgi:inhibitor of cysteine peptidase
MKSKILLAIALLAVLLVTVGCSTVNAQKPENVPPANREITITNTDDFTQNAHIQKQIDVNKGASVIITLVSNGTTGFSWNENAVIADAGILQQTSHQQIAADSDKIGAAGSEQWTIKALKTGQTTVHLEYGRPWEGGERAVWILDVTVTVK